MKIIPSLMVVLVLATNAWAHEHKPPHGGTLVVCGEEFAHLEFVLEPKEGKLTAYVLDGEAEKAVTLSQLEITVKIQLSAGSDGAKPPEFTLKLAAVPNVLTGEKVGDTSQFEAQADALKNVAVFDGTVSGVTIKGSEFKDIPFNYPKGNE